MEAIGARRRREALAGLAVAAALAVCIPAGTAVTAAGAASAVAAPPPRIPVTLQSERLVQPLPIVSSCPPSGAACQQDIISAGYPAMPLRADAAVQLQLGASARSLSVDLGGLTTPLGSGQAASWRVPSQGGDAILTAVYPQGTVAYLLRFSAQPAPAPPVGPAPAAGAPSGVGAASPAAGSDSPAPPVTTVCAPAVVHLETAHGGVDAPVVGPACHALGAPLSSLAPSDLARAAAGARLTLRAGTALRLRFDSPPRGSVRVELRRGSDLRLALTDQLPAVATTWRARGPGGGVVVVVARFRAPVAAGATALVEARYAARLVLK
jgi:hypothetical protein